MWKYWKLVPELLGEITTVECDSYVLKPFGSSYLNKLLFDHNTLNAPRRAILSTFGDHNIVLHITP